MDSIYVGWLSLLPPVIAIVLALLTKEVISSLLIGILSGGLIYSIFTAQNPILGTIQTTFKLMANRMDLDIILFLALLGALVVVMGMAGGTSAYGRWASKKLTSKRKASFATVILGALIFIDDYFNCLTVGTVMKPVTDKFKISRAKLAYIIDSTAAPICIIAPISSWAAAVGSNISPTGAFSSDLTAFIATIPYNLYALLSIAMVIIMCCTNLDFGPMAKCEERATKGDLGAVDVEVENSFEISKKGHVLDMIIPVIALILFSVLAMLQNGGYWSDPEYGTIAAAFGNCSASPALVLGGFGALVVAFIMFVPRKVVKFSDFMSGVTLGIKSMVPAFIILTLAWTISGVCRDLLMTGEFVKTMVEGSNIPGMLIPAIIFAVAAFLSFSMGTAWGTFGILIPIVITVCNALVPELLIVSLSATLAGSVFGDHCSPISDTTILSSTGAGCNHIEHVSTQIPYSITVAICSFIGYIVSGVTGGNIAITLIVSFACLFTFIFILHKRTVNKMSKKA